MMKWFFNANTLAVGVRTEYHSSVQPDVTFNSQDPWKSETDYNTLRNVCPSWYTNV